MKKLTTQLLIIIALIMIHNPLYSQIDNESMELEENVNNINDFSKLEDERLRIIGDMYASMYEISGLFTELERSQSLERLIRQYNRLNTKENNLDSISKKHKEYIQRLEEIKSKIVLPELRSVGGQELHDMESMTVTEGFRRIIENKVQEILKKTDQLSSVGTKVTELNNTSYVSQNFKKQISWSFALLVAIVIIGFFIIAYRDDEIRKTIFSGDAGLQFITIFSIIIAIILFGITGVLGGKEISALIGGISGYILGRSSIGSNKSESKK
ncbi:hypothetical protein IMCC3317_02240 [Kordia antarctica]|uniref:Uncharacterized protein n=1 Tax=Kordia antarctica TaxID=1218801 RepID=A0A7L4ZEB4_9FLAO|nr:hypothetical protein [Kordia antarctica]QHI34879.1 hypothetical protein IMCC3317_02240 [Kordia antarctica]